MVFVSDNQSWADFRNDGSRTTMTEEWERLRGRNPKAKLVLIDVQPYASTQVAASNDRDDVLNVGGFSDAVFDVVTAFIRGDLGGDTWLRAIQSVALD